jgi:hypothetical protein
LVLWTGVLLDYGEKKILTNFSSCYLLSKIYLGDPEVDKRWN